MMVFSLTAGEEVSAMSMVTESLKLRDCGGVMTSVWNERTGEKLKVVKKG